MNKSILTPLLIAGLLSWGQVRAHHSFSTHYDMGELIEIMGVVAEVKLRNPHSFLLIDVTTEEGVVERWEVEAHAIPLMRRMGFEMDTMQVGDTLTIRGPRARTDKNLTFAGQIILEDGTEFSLLSGALGPQLTAAFVQDASEVQTDGSILDRVVGRWGHITEGNGEVGETPMALSSAGRLARANYDPRETPAMNCIAPNLPSLFHAPYLLDIRADDEQPVIFHEYYSVARPLTLSATVAAPADYGRRTTRIDGDVLVIESVGFAEDPAGLASDWDFNGRGRNNPGSGQKKVIESYTLRENDSILVLDYTVEDAVYLSEPYAARVEWQRLRDDAPIYDFECDLETATRSTLNAAPVE